MMRRSLPLLGLLLVISAAVSALDSALVITPRAQVLPISATNRPFLAAGQTLQPVDLVTRGYLESEWRITGRANVYDWAPAGDALKVRAPDVPYVTRILVRQPRDAVRFSGRVIVELLDASAGYDTAPLWGLSWEYFTRHGDAWVGVTVSPAAVAALRRFDSVRYAATSFALTQPESCPANAGNALAWDVIAQVGALLRSSSKENPLLVLNPQRFIAAGYGQSGGYLLTYANVLHARQRLGDGAPIFDGYLSVMAANAAPISPCAPVLAANDVRGGVQPRDVPFVMVQADSAAQGATPFRDDSDAPGDVFRLYQIAATGQSAPDAAGQPAPADLTIAGGTPPAEASCRELRRNFSSTYALNAIWQQYDELLLHQLPMNKEPRGVEAGGVLRDVVDDARSRQACSTTASAQPPSVATLKARYGSRAEYLRRFNAAVDEALRQRRIVAEDVAALKALAQRAPAF